MSTSSWTLVLPFRFSKVITSLSSACRYHIRDLRRVRHTLDFATASTVAISFLRSRLDYFESFYHALSVTIIKCLQQIQNVTSTPKHSDITLALRSSHWLKVEQQVQFKLISIVHNFLHKSEPSYLCKHISIKRIVRICASDTSVSRYFRS